jgi:hypothetical protein
MASTYYRQLSQLYCKIAEPAIHYKIKSPVVGKSPLMPPKFFLKISTLPLTKLNQSLILLKLNCVFVRNKMANSSNYTKALPIKCPACARQLKVRKLLCQECKTEIDGVFDLPQLSRLSAEDQDFILQFIKASGSLKEMARLLKLSYPTVRNRLDEIIEHIKKGEENK